MTQQLILEPRDFRLESRNSFLTYFSGGEEMRVVIFLDVDAFECQLWVKKCYPKYVNQAIPIVVVNPDRVILSVNYSAKILGLDRSMTKNELHIAKITNPSLKILETGRRSGRWDTFAPHEESDKILGVIMAILNEAEEVPVQRASRDEFYMEIGKPLRDGKILYPEYDMVELLSASRKTDPNPEYHGDPTCVLEGDERSYWGGSLSALQRSVPAGEEAELIRAGTLALYLVNRIEEATGYICSAGVGPNKLLAKIACTLWKPEAVTMLTTRGFKRISNQLPHSVLHGLKGRTGEQLQQHFSKAGEQLTVELLRLQPIRALVDFYLYVRHSQSPWRLGLNLYYACRGIDGSPVRHRLFDDAISVTHSFRGKYALYKRRHIKGAMEALARDMWGRFLYAVFDQGRLPKGFVATMEVIGQDGRSDHLSSRMPLDVEDRSMGWSTLCHFLLDLIEAKGYDSYPRYINRMKLSAKGFASIGRNCGLYYYDSRWLRCLS